MTAANHNVGHLGHHDLGGSCDVDAKIDLSDHKLSLLDRQVDAAYYILSEKKLINAHELRMEIEKIPADSYKSCTYYEKWAFSIIAACIKHAVFTEAELQEAMGPDTAEEKQLFKAGDRVTVRSENVNRRWRKPHIRTPGYLFGATGVVERYVGNFGNPEQLAFMAKGTQPLYRVRFNQNDIWSLYEGDDTIDVEIYQSWLHPAATADADHIDKKQKQEPHPHPPPLVHPHHHHDDEHHEHEHEERRKVEETAVVREGHPGLFEFVQKALIETLQRKRMFTAAELTAKIAWIDSLGERFLGAKVVAKAWKDKTFRAALLANGSAAIEAAFGININTHLCVVENTRDIHNVVVCTLCSCYPRQLLGIPPAWYKSRAPEYRARCVYQPRKVLAEFGTVLPATTTVRVHDSTADLRYLVIPLPPDVDVAATTEEALAKMVTRDGMVGVTVL